MINYYSYIESELVLKILKTRLILASHNLIKPMNVHVHVHVHIHVHVHMSRLIPGLAERVGGKGWRKSLVWKLKF